MLKKQFLKNKPVCKVTFYTEELEGASAFVVGDFNNWNAEQHPMQKLKDGRFKTVIDLESGKEFAFRYLVHGAWHNDAEPDREVQNEFGGTNSIVSTVEN